MDNKKYFFLDTATQIARHWHSPPVRNEISQQLNSCKLYCSRYVKCQYKDTFLDSLIRLHTLSLRSQDFLEAILKVTEVRYTKEAGGKLTPGVLVRVVEIAYWISRECKTFEKQVGRLRDLIEGGWEEFFEEGLELPLIDETGCRYADVEPEVGVSGAYNLIKVSCTKDNPLDCNIKDFWNKHQIHLGKLANMDIESIEAKNKDKRELDRVKKHARKIMGGKYSWGMRCRVYLSDAIICIESKHCPERVVVHSINKKHFQPLGEVLGVECEPRDEID